MRIWFVDLWMCTLYFLLWQAAGPIVETILYGKLKQDRALSFFVPSFLVDSGFTPSIGMVTDYRLEESL